MSKGRTFRIHDNRLDKDEAVVKTTPEHADGLHSIVCANPFTGYIKQSNQGRHAYRFPRRHKEAMREHLQRAGWKEVEFSSPTEEP